MMAVYLQNFVRPTARPHSLEEHDYGEMISYPPTRFESSSLFPHESVYDDRTSEYRSEEIGFVEDSSYRRNEAASRDRFQDRDKEERRSRNSEDDYRDRERERDRSRRHDRERERSSRESRHDHHDRERRGSRERRDRSDRDRDSRGRSPTKSSNIQDGSLSSDPDRDRDERGGEKWMTDTPTHTILLRGLHVDAEETDIRAELSGTPVKDVRLMRRKDTGTSRGFAFVEFKNIADSQRWMDQNQGRLCVLGKYSVNLYYSTPKSLGEKITDHKTDWSCSKCGAHNFKRRDYCFKCGVSREESERTLESDGYDQVGTNPCNTLIFRGLDALTTEDKLLSFIKKLGSNDVKNVRIIRDPVNNVSRGYGFAEMASIQKSTLFLDQIKTKHPTLELDGKLLMVAFAKNTFNTVMATFGNQSAWNYGQVMPGYQGYDYSAYDPTGQYFDYSGYYGAQQPAVPSNNAAAVAQAAIQQAQAAKQYKAGNVDATFPGDYVKYPPPDVSTYQYEETSGYYFDPSTGLYYDPGSQYYYNAQSGQFMYWDGEKSTYLPAPASAQTEADPNKETPKEKEKKEKVKVAKKIAKDMEKWAKSLNAQKDSLKDGPKKVAQSFGERESATADLGFAILEKKQTEKSEDVVLMPPPSMPVAKQPSPSTAALVDYGGGDSDSEEDDTSSGLPLSERLIDWGKMACLLCKRQFNTPEMLNKHTQLSDLHKQNLESLIKTKTPPQPINDPLQDSYKDSYRDRAKERRQKYGTGIPPTIKKKKAISMFEDPVIAEQPTKAGLGQDNIGNKLLQKMGWSLGQGLGKAGQGITKPIQAKRRVVQAGLGAEGSSVISDPGDTYKVAVKKTMFARYHEVE